MINGGVYTIFHQLWGRARVESLCMSSFKRPPLKVSRAWKKAHRDDRAISGVSFPPWPTHTHTHTTMHICTYTCTANYKHTSLYNIYTRDHPSIAGTSGIAVTCFQEAELISLVRCWVPENDRVQVGSGWVVCRPCSFTLPLSNAPCRINTTTNLSICTQPHSLFV